MERRVAILTDVHALLEPVEAILEDVKKRDITEVYSLGDNIGLGPNPNEVVSLLSDKKVKSIAGNYEEYELLGIEPFSWYMTESKIKSRNWTSSVLTKESKKIISCYPHSIDLVLGGKKIALCHFANDVRFDYYDNDSWGYVDKLKHNSTGYKQFLYTNSKEQINDIDNMVKKYGLFDYSMRGYLSSIKEPLFNGNQITMYDTIIQGHAHWKLCEKTPFGSIYTIRSAGMAYDKDPVDMASYVILKENENGFSIEDVLVKYDREKMKYSILNSTSPDQDIKKYICL